MNDVLGCPVLSDVMWKSMHTICPPFPGCPALIAFTDGSSIEWCSVYAFGLCRADSCPPGFFPSPANTCLSSGPSPGAGRTFVAEAMAIMGAVMSVPTNANLRVITDALSVK